MALKVNPNTDEFKPAPAGEYTALDNEATLVRLYMDPSRWENDDGGHDDVLKAVVRFVYDDPDTGDRRPMTLTDQFDRGILRTLRQLGQDTNALPRDDDGNIEVPTDEDDNVLIDGAVVSGVKIDAKVTVRAAKNDPSRRFNNIAAIWLPQTG